MCKEIFELRKKHHYMMTDKKWNVRYTIIFLVNLWMKKYAEIGKKEKNYIDDGLIFCR
ncbi:MAG: hypothetical protein J6A10_08420 [Peptococcaceae bacterium]|nr:hypothetical protein [Peptococcaceae bacterium]MBO5429969.1 hypothetical protein [Peptococcaceae bacterium]